MRPDLELRIHAPIPEVVIVRVSGTVDRRTAPVVAKRVSHQLTRAPHIVVDLGDVPAVDPGALAVLRTLHQHAIDNGTEIHLVRAEYDAVRRALRTMALDQMFTLDSMAEAVIAGLPRQATSHPRSSPERTQSTGSGQPDSGGHLA